MTAPESPSVLLRAASLLKARAQAATPGPWEHPEPGEITRGFYVRKRDGMKVATWLATTSAGDGDLTEEQGEANAEYIATMHPLVALALADMLKSFDTCGCEEGDDHWREKSAALVVARAVLGELEAEGAGS